MGGRVLRVPYPEDAAGVHALILSCPPLDPNSLYAYLLLCSHFSDTCVLAEAPGRTVGFLSAYRLPSRPGHVFVWQIAVASPERGRGLGYAMLQELIARPTSHDLTFLETTITPSNQPSRALFRKLAKDLGAPLTEGSYFEREHFGGRPHEEEKLIRIGPFKPGPKP